MLTILEKNEFYNKFAKRMAVEDSTTLSPAIQEWIDYTKAGIDTLYYLNDEAKRLSSHNNSMYTFFLGGKDKKGHTLPTCQEFYDMYKAYVPTYDLLSLQHPLEKCPEEIKMYGDFDKEWAVFSRHFSDLQKAERNRIPYLYGAIPQIKSAIIACTNAKQKAQLTKLLNKAQTLANEDNNLKQFDIIYTDNTQLHNGNLNPLNKILNRYKILRTNTKDQNAFFNKCRVENPNIIKNILSICNDYTSTNINELNSLLKNGVSHYEFFKMWETENGLEQFINNAKQTLRTLSNIMQKFQFAELNDAESIQLNKLEENANNLDINLRQVIEMKKQREAYIASRFKNNSLDSVDNPQNVELHKLAMELRKMNKFAGYDKLVDTEKTREQDEEFVY